jgi:ribonuclease D
VADLGGWDDDRSANHDRLTRLGFFDTLKTTVESPAIWTVMHNGLFELCWLGHKYGIKAWRCADTMLLSQLLWAGIEAYRHSLKAVGERLGISIDKEQQRSDWGWPLSNEQINYAANDVRVLFPFGAS